MDQKLREEWLYIEGLYNYKLVIMTAWVQLNAPVWVAYKQKQREPIIRCRRPQGRVPVAQPEPVWEVLCLTGEVQRKHAAGQALPSSPLFNLITVMSLETVGCTTSNVDADKHTLLALTGSWMQSASSGSNSASLDGSLTIETVRVMDVNGKIAIFLLKVKQVAQRKIEKKVMPANKYIYNIIYHFFWVKYIWPSDLDLSTISTVRPANRWEIPKSQFIKKVLNLCLHTNKC